MEIFVNEFIKQIVGIVIGLTSFYFLTIHRHKVDIEIMKKDLEKLRSDLNNIENDIRKEIGVIQKRLDSHSRKNDEIITLINELKMEMIKQLGSVATSMAKISSDVENINSTIAIFDDGIRSKKKKKG